MTPRARTPVRRWPRPGCELFYCLTAIFLASAIGAKFTVVSSSKPPQMFAAPDHCAGNELEALLALTRPSRIECPGYDPHCDHADGCLSIIKGYRDDRRNSNRRVTIDYVTPTFIGGLGTADTAAFNDIFYHPNWIDPDCNNDNSTVKLFRRGSFNVLSLGDVESVDLSARLRRSKYLTRETDVMILAHHGADNGFTNRRFLQAVEPQLAICSPDYANQHNDPAESIRELLADEGVLLLTTKTGDVIVKSIDTHIRLRL